MIRDADVVIFAVIARAAEGDPRLNGARNLSLPSCNVVLSWYYVFVPPFVCGFIRSFLFHHRTEV